MTWRKVTVALLVMVMAMGVFTLGCPEPEEPLDPPVEEELPEPEVEEPEELPDPDDVEELPDPFPEVEEEEEEDDDDPLFPID